MPATPAGQALASAPEPGLFDLFDRSASAALQARASLRKDATNTLLADPRLWRAASLGASNSPCVPSGFATLDAELPGGGWPTRMLSELLLTQAASCEWRLLGPALRALLAGSASPGTAPSRGRRAAARATAKVQVKPQGKPLLLINPAQTPHLPGLRVHGIGAEQLIWIAPEPGRHQARQSLWATEQAIKANAAAAILAWLPEVRPEQMRRLQAAAMSSEAPVFVLRPLSAQAQSSAAPLRLLLTTGTAWQLQVHILKRRGPAHEGWLALPSIPAELAALLTPRVLALPTSSALPSSPSSPSSSTSSASRAKHDFNEPAHALARAPVPAVQR